MKELSESTIFSDMLPAFDVVKAIIILVLGYLLAKSLSNLVARFNVANMTKHGQVLLRRGIFYGVMVLMFISALRELGFDLSVVLGAAGILSVAIGFASQTSASNLISGLFLMMERPFSIGDVIRVDETTGEVISIDLLSVKIRTYDNLFVRVPNESMIKAQVTTLTRFPIRRADLKVGIAYKEDIEQVKIILAELADKNPLCLSEPAPLFILLGFGSSSIDIQFSVWTKRENFLLLKNQMYQQIKQVFDANGIEIPFPHLSLYSGEASKPIPVSLSQNEGEGERSAPQSPSKSDSK
ncbi:MULTISPECIES: mechanosensitive ion channel family protein [Alteromonadaceae]|uniref:mechanosensitive ion channel family protein n=1 Tax=Alteromonadaceae TaxID=72275 RepID=UPI001C09D1A1|nr:MULTISPECIES: mechanosensitive ion channel family protein [Aliiglaciecola]MBU2876719.1 mechanosensitive ion channel family protein [Aliiglaciecola lipolytica]MDO6710311.1 mechanosensitive ion channel family protein [Aliiglaciecola sp. 2_MG-2023]MDO6751459.1 mechanosensitive ion channel family protein [Aliiglaciecola sp. 1_MG-2023]